MKTSIVYNCHVTCCDWSQQVTWYQQRGWYSDLSSARVRGTWPVPSDDRCFTVSGGHSGHRIAVLRAINGHPTLQCHCPAVYIQRPVGKWL
ncbi:unnamed protein product, partial [Staurois parvus]